MEEVAVEEKVPYHIRRCRARDILRPETFVHLKIPKGTHPVAKAIAILGKLLTKYRHEWTRHEKHFYKIAIHSVRHPVCPQCAKPMAESIVMTGGLDRKYWHCETCQNL